MLRGSGKYALGIGLRLSLLVFLMPGGFASAQGQAVMAVSNPTNLARPEEIVEIPLTEIRARLGGNPANLSAEDLSSHRELPVQMERGRSSMAADKLLVLVSLDPHETMRLVIHATSEPARGTPLVFGRAVPERKDDFAWENDKVAYRVYGPALQATGEITSGIDVWSKRVPDLIVNTWYRRDAEGQRTDNPAMSYHKDSGQGLDSYEVGPTRGCGGTGLWANGHLYVSKNYVHAEILESGPIRFRFRLRYAPWQADGFEVSEEKVITLDAGSHLNRIESTFSFSRVLPSGKEAPQWAAGLAMHSGAHLATSDDGGILLVWEPLTDPHAGMDGTAIVLEPGQTAKTIQEPGNAFVLLPATPEAPVAYYAGAAWSKADIPDEAAWSRYLAGFRERLQHPLKTRWQSIE